MNGCMTIKGLGTMCAGDLSFKLGDVQIDLISPGMGAMVVLLTVIGVFVFRSPA